MWWSTVSNALERSIKTPSVYSPFSKKPVISRANWFMACLIELYLCFSYIRLFESRWLFTLSNIILSNTFENTGRMDMGP